MLWILKCRYIHVFVNFKRAGTCAWVVVVVSLSQVCPRSIPRSIPKVYPEVYQKHAAMIKALRGPFYDICFIFWYFSYFLIFLNIPLYFLVFLVISMYFLMLLIILCTCLYSVYFLIVLCISWYLCVFLGMSRFLGNSLYFLIFIATNIRM